MTEVRVRWQRGAAAAALGAAWIALLFAPLLPAGRALATRDVALFHLPLRASFAWLCRLGPPVWNPLLHGGQPLLSNPNYAAFYPPSWLALALEPARALTWIALLHAALGLAGAWRLARRLGCGPWAAALAATAYAGSGAVLSLLSAFNFFCGMAWLPWVLLGGEAALRPPSGAEGAGWRSWAPGAAGAGLALAGQLLAGEPAAALVGALALAALGATQPRRLPRLALAVALAALFAAVQLLPTLGRLAGSPRAGGVAAAQAVVWSTRPERWIELALPRFFGDAARAEEGLYFGWHLNDRGYPYVPSLYPGLLVTLLALCALLRWPVPRRAAWALAVAAGALLAAGRYNPLYAFLRTALPPLGLVRFPEKFALLAVAVLPFAAALGWQWLLDERRAGRPERADLPLALAAGFLALAAGLTLTLHAAPGLARWVVAEYGVPGADKGAVARGAAALLREGWAAVGTAAATALLLALCRWRRTPERLLAAGAVLLLAADLWHYEHGLVHTLPAAAYREPPPLARTLARLGASIYAAPPPDDKPEVMPRTPGLDDPLVRVQLARLDPASGALWGLPYAFDEDYDLMLTRPARQALALLHLERQRPGLLWRLLGAWNVAAVLERRVPERWIAEAVAGGPLRPVRVQANPHLLPRYRLVARASFHPTAASALGAARAQLYALDRGEHFVRPGGPPETRAYPGRPDLRGVEDRGGEIAARYRSATPAFFTAAVTFDRGWRAEVDGRPVPVYEEAVGQLGVALPAGEHRLRLAYRDPLVAIGAAVSLLALAGALVGWRLARGAAPGSAAGSPAGTSS
jgi:hypothetical protein